MMERRDIEVQVGSSNRIPITLELGDLTETVEIRGGAPLIQSSNASIGTVIDNRSIVELPLNGRNYLQLASLIPGATTNGPSSSQGRQRMGGQRNSFALNVAGQRMHCNHYSLDGVENTDLNFNSYMLLPSVDALQEFKVEAGLFDAEDGRAIAQINASTKSGSNGFTGRVRVRAQLVARCQELLRPGGSPDSTVQAEPVRAHGRRAGGRAKLVDGKNRLFFLFNWEGLREHKSLTSSPAVPLTAWRTGDFSQLRDTSGNLIPIYDPATRVFDAAGNVTQAPTAFPGNRIPGGSYRPGLAATAGLLSVAATGAGRRQLRQRRSPDGQRRSVHLSIRLHRRRQLALVLPSQPLARARLRSVRDPRHGHQHRHGRAPAGAGQHPDVRLEQGQRRTGRIRVSEERAHLAAREQRQRGQGARDQPAERQPALLGCAEHRHYRPLRTRGRERRALHQRRQDDSGRRQLLVDRRQACLQVRRRGPSRPLRSDRRRRHARAFCVRRTLHAEPSAARRAARRRRDGRLPAGHVQSRRRPGRGTSRQLPLELLRALLPGQLEADQHSYRQLRAALGI